MKPLDRLPAHSARALEGVLFDLDDTVLDHGLLTETAYNALWNLSRAGLRLIAVTGRPCGWAEVMARQWPVTAVVAENGAVAVFREGVAVRRWDTCDEAERRRRRIRLARAFDHLRARFPEARLSDDSGARITDLALDIGESQKVPEPTVRAMSEECKSLGLRTFTSTVHLHLTLDPYDKASGVVAFLGNHLQCDATAVRSRFAYVGDSANDAPAFAAFELTFGVANVKSALAALSVTPRYVAIRERGAGFREIADRLVHLRNPAEPAENVLDRRDG